MCGFVVCYIFYFLPSFAFLPGISNTQKCFFYFGMVICRVGVVLYAGGDGKKWVVVENFSTGDKTPYRASGFFYTTTFLLLDDMVDTLKNHIHFNHRNWQVAYSPFSPGLRVELRGEISSRMQGFYSCRENDTDVFNLKYWMRETDDLYSYEKTELFQAVKLY